MSRFSDAPSGRRLAIVVIALIALFEVALFGASMCIRSGRDHAAPGGPGRPTAGATAPSDTLTSDALIGRALALARRDAPRPPDSSAIKSAWQEEVRGADLTRLSARSRELFLRFANAERCTCGCGYTLAGCLASDMTCEVSGARVAELLDSLRAGRIHDTHGLRERPRRL